MLGHASTLGEKSKTEEAELSNQSSHFSQASRSLNQFPAIGGAIDCGPYECDNALGGFV